MQSYIDTLLTNINEGNFIAVPIVLLVGLLFNLKVILNFLDERKKVKLTNINEAIACDYIDDKTKELFKEESSTWA